MVFVHVFVHGTKEIINILVISLIQSELHSLIIRESLVQAQVGPPKDKDADNERFNLEKSVSFSFVLSLVSLKKKSIYGGKPKFQCIC